MRTALQIVTAATFVLSSALLLLLVTILVVELYVTTIQGFIPFDANAITAWATAALAFLGIVTMIANYFAIRAARDSAKAALFQLSLAYPVLRIRHVDPVFARQEAITGTIEVAQGTMTARDVDLWAKSHEAYYNTQGRLWIYPGSPNQFRLTKATVGSSPFSTTLNSHPDNEVWLAVSWLIPDGRRWAFQVQVFDERLGQPIYIEG